MHNAIGLGSNGNQTGSGVVGGGLGRDFIDSLCRIYCSCCIVVIVLFLVEEAVCMSVSQQPADGGTATPATSGTSPYRIAPPIGTCWTPWSMTWAGWPEPRPWG